jgi:hypothetical protein
METPFAATWLSLTTHLMDFGAFISAHRGRISKRIAFESESEVRIHCRDRLAAGKESHESRADTRKLVTSELDYGNEAIRKEPEIVI